jgi:2',3'-cyclic-nucleotide 2'-phosphodiesterase (5'-nucleotidase family)
MDTIFGTQVTGYCEQICCIKKLTRNSCLNSYNNSNKVIKNNYKRYHKVVNKLLQRSNIGTATDRLHSSVIKKGAVWKNI